MKKTLEVRNLSKYLINKNVVNKVVDNVSFDLLEGEILGILGQNDSGKSVIGQSILRMTNEVNGTIVVDDKIISSPKITNEALNTFKKNVQSISSDSVSSLDDRWSTYQILEEALYASDKSDNELLKYWDNWKELADIFKYESKLSYKTDLADLLTLKKNMITKYYDDLNVFLDNYTYDKERKFQENIEVFLFERYTKKFNIYRDLANSLIDYELAQFDKIDEYKRKFDNRDLKPELVDYINAVENLHKFDASIKRSQNYQKKLHSLNIARNDEIKLLSKETNFNVKAIRNDLIVRNKFHKNLADNTEVFKTYETSMLRCAAIQMLLKAIRKVPSKLKILTAEQIIELSSEITDITTQTTKLMIDKVKKEQSITLPSNKTNDSIMQHKISLDNAKLNFETLSRNPENKSDISNAKKAFDLAQSNYDKEANKIAKIEFSLRKKIIDKVVIETSIDNFNFDKYIKYSDDNIQQIRDKHSKIIQDEKVVEKNKPEFSNRIRKSLIEKINQTKAFKDELILKSKNTIESEIKVIEEEIKTLSAYFWTKEWNTRQKSIVNSFKLKTKAIIDAAKECKVSKVEINSFKSIINDYEKRTMNLQLETDMIMQRIDRIQNVFELKNVRQCKKLKVAKQINSDRHIFKTLREVGMSASDSFRNVSNFDQTHRFLIVLARLLMVNPQIIVADEFVIKLDKIAQLKIISILKKIAKTRNISMLYIGSDASQMQFIADNTLIMHMGKIIEFGESSQVFQHPAHIYTKCVLASTRMLSNEFKQFENINSYIHEYSDSQRPKYHSITDEHFVFCTNEQLSKWSREDVVDIMTSKKDNVVIVDDNKVNINIENTTTTNEASLIGTVYELGNELNEIIQSTSKETFTSNSDIITSSQIDTEGMPLIHDKNEENVEDKMFDENIYEDEEQDKSFDLNGVNDIEQPPLTFIDAQDEQDTAIDNDVNIEFTDVTPLSTDELSVLQDDNSNTQDASETTINDEVNNIETPEIESISEASDVDEQVHESHDENIVNEQSGWVSEPIVELVEETPVIDEPIEYKAPSKNKAKAKVVKTKSIPTSKSTNKVTTDKKKVVKAPKTSKNKEIDIDSQVIQQYVDNSSAEAKQSKAKTTKKDNTSKKQTKIAKVEKTHNKSKALSKTTITSLDTNKPSKVIVKEKVIAENKLHTSKKIRETERGPIIVPQHRIKPKDTLSNTKVNDTFLPLKKTSKHVRPERAKSVDIVKVDRTRTNRKVTKQTLNLEGYFIDKTNDK